MNDIGYWKVGVIQYYKIVLYASNCTRWGIISSKSNLMAFFSIVLLQAIVPLTFVFCWILDSNLNMTPHSSPWDLPGKQFMHHVSLENPLCPLSHHFICRQILLIGELNKSSIPPIFPSNWTDLLLGLLNVTSVYYSSRICRKEIDLLSSPLYRWRKWSWSPMMDWKPDSRWHWFFDVRVHVIDCLVNDTAT